MIENDELLIKLELEFQKKFESQRKFYESQLELLRSEYEYYKNKMQIELENKVNWAKEEVKSFYDVKSLEDSRKLKSYYEQQMESQKNWYESEIKRRQKDTEDWHIKNFEEKISQLRNEYEEKLRKQEETFNTFINEQKRVYEEQIKPFHKFMSIQDKIGRKFNKFFKKRGIETIRHSNVPYPIESSNLNYPSPGEVLLPIQQSECNPIKVSVILPVYNVGKYLRQSLDSLINQTLKDIEIICIDDGSTDNSYEILEEYKSKDKRIKVVHKSNKGTGAARNDGLKLAKGECIGFVDPDDWVKPNMFERLYKEIKAKNLDIAMCMPDGYDEKSNKYRPFPYFVDENFKNIIDDRVFNWKDLSPFKYPMCVWNKLYTKKLFDKNEIEFAEGLDFEDHKVIFGALLSAERVFFIREKLYVYRFNREGSVLTDNNRRLLDHIKIFDIVEELMKKTNTFNELRMDFLTYKVHNLLYYYEMIKEEYKREYYEEMVKSLRTTNLTKEEFNIMSDKYPVLKKIFLE